jgi:hypothetical protein
LTKEFEIDKLKLQGIFIELGDGGEMINPMHLEEAYREFSHNLGKWVPDGIIDVNLQLLHELGFLHLSQLENSKPEDFTQYFNVIETSEKVTLFNEQFAIWIVPKLVNDIPATMTYISLLNNNKPHLEIVFSTSGVYNSPKYILKVLQHFLSEVLDTEAIITEMGKKK